MSGWDIGFICVGSIDVLTNIPKKLMSMSTQPHLMDIIYFFTDFSHGLGTLTESDILETMGGYTTQPRFVFYNQQTSLSTAFEICFQSKILQDMPCVVMLF